MIKSLLNFLGEIVLRSTRLRAAAIYLCNRIEGFQYDSYSLEDETALAVSFVNNSSRGGVIIDAGANKGLFTQGILNSGTNFKKILMVEPQTALCDNLERIASEIPAVTLEKVAVGSHSGTMDLYFDAKGSGLASLYERDIRHVGLSLTDSESVPITTLDLLAEKHSLEQIDYLKLDLEGHELEALKGASRLLEENRIRVITFEFGGCNIDSRTYLKDFWRLLVNSYGFTFYRLLPGQRLLEIDSYSESLERFNWQNILACAPGIKPIWNITR